MKKSVVLSLTFAVLLFGFFSFVSANPSCGATITTNTTLDGNMTCSGTALVLGADNLVLDCTGYTINFSTGGASSTYGVYSVSGRNNITIKNCNIVDGNWSTSGTSRYGIYVRTTTNSNIMNNSISTNSSIPIYFYSASNYNNVTSNNVTSISSAGILLASSNNNRLVSNNCTSNSAEGIRLTTSTNNTLISNIGTSVSSYGIYLYSSSTYNNLTLNNGTSISGNGIYVSGSSYGNFTSNIGTSNSGYGFYSVSSHYGNWISNKGISNSAVGIYLILSNYTKLDSNNGTSYSSYGVYVSFCYFGNFTSNYASGTTNGFYLYDGQQNNLTNNIGVTNYTGLSTYAGIRIDSSYNNFVNNTGVSTSDSTGIYTLYPNNNFTSDAGTSNSGYGFYLVSSNNNLTSPTARSNSNYAMYLQGTSNNSISRGNVSGLYGYAFRVSNFTNVSDCIYTVGSSADIYIQGDNGSIENSFINCSYTNESISGSYDYILRKWYYDTNLTYANGTAVEGVNVTMINSSGGIVFSTLTDSNGDINRFEFTDYIHYGGYNNYKSYITNTVNFSKSGVANSSKIYYPTYKRGIENSPSSTYNIFDTIVYPIQFLITYPYQNILLQRGANFTISGNVTGNIEGFSNISSFTVEYSGTTSGSYTFTGFSNNSFNVSMPLSAGAYTLKIYDTNNPNVSQTISPVYVGDIILIIGQSNAFRTIGYPEVGYSPTQLVYLATQDDTIGLGYNSSVGFILENLTSDWRDAKMAYNISLSENVPVMIANFALGGTALFQWQNSSSEDYYRLAVNHIRNITGGSMNIKAVYWYQGESDVAYQNYSGYYLNLSRLINNSFSDMNILSGKFVVGQILKSGSDTVSPLTVREAQQDVWYNVTNATRGPITYDIQLEPSGVHFGSSGNDNEKSEFASRMMKSVMYSVYGVGENYPIVENAYLVNDTLLYVKYSKTGLEVSNWNGTDTTSKAYGFNLTNGTSYVDDAYVTNTVLSDSILKVYFNTSISGLSNLSICNAFSCYGKNVVRNSGNNLPMEIVYNMSVTTSGETVCGYQGKYWYSGACHSTAQSTSSSESSGNSNYILGVYSPSENSLKNGYSVNVKAQQKVVVSSSDVTIESVSDGEVIVSVDGSSYTILDSSSTKIDLDNDGFYDVEIVNNGVTGEYANLEFTLINEAVPSNQQDSESGNVIDNSGSTDVKIGFWKSIGNFFSNIWDWISFWN